MTFVFEGTEEKLGPTTEIRRQRNDQLFLMDFAFFRRTLKKMNSFEKGFFVSRLRKVLKVDNKNIKRNRTCLWSFAHDRRDFARWKKERLTELLLDQRKTLQINEKKKERLCWMKERHCRSSKDFANEVLLMNELEVIASWA